MRAEELPRLLADPLDEETLAVAGAIIADVRENKKAALRAHTLIGHVEDLVYSASLSYTGEIMRGWESSFEISSAIGQTEAVRAGAGIGILHDYIARQHAELVRILPEITIRRAYWTTYHESARELVRVRTVVQFLQELADENRRIFV